MSECNDCRGKVFFLPLGTYHDTGKVKWSRPMDKKEEDIVPVPGGGFQSTILFLPHVCAESAERIAAKQEKFARNETVEEQWARALQWECTDCGAGVGVKCKNKRDPDKVTYRPHRPRLQRSNVYL